MPKGSSSARDLILGLLFFGALGALGYVTTQLRSIPGLGGDRQYLNVLFQDVYGVRQEDSVLVHGTRYGRVVRVTPIPAPAWRATGRDLVAENRTTAPFQPNVLMVIELEVPVELHEGYGVFAEDTNLLGGKVVAIDPGPVDRLKTDAGPLERSDLDATDPEELKKVTLVGRRKPHPIAAIGELVEDNLDGISEIVENLRDATGALDDESRQGAIGYLLTNPESRERAKSILDSLDELAAQTRQPGTLMNDLFYETPLRNNLNSSVESLRQFMDDARSPGSLLGSLVNADSTLKRDIDQAAASLRELGEKANRPDSMVGKLLDESENSIGSKVDQLVTNLNQFVNDAKGNSDSLFYNLFYGEMGASARNAIARFESLAESLQTSVIDPIQSQTGILGYLIKDEDAKKKLDRLVNATLGIIEDAREAAPITSLGSFIFGGF